MKRTAESTITFSLEQLHIDQPAAGKTNLILQILMSAVFALSLLAGTLEAIQISVPYGGVVITVMISAAVLQAMTLLSEKKKRIGSVICFMIPLFGAGILWKWTRNGIAIIANQVLSIFGVAEKQIFMLFMVDAEIDAALSILVVCIVITVWLTMLTSELQREIHPFISISIAVLLMILNGCLPQWESGIWLLVTGLCTGLLLAKDFLGQKKLYWQMTAVVLCITTGVGLAALMAGEPLENWKSDLTASVRGTVEEQLHAQRYGDDSQRAMPMGDFSQLENLVFSDAHMLRITGDEFESLYLRGFVGGVFNGERWTQVDGEALYAHADAFYWLHEEGYFGQNLLAKSAQILDQKATKEKKNFTVENLAADSSVFYTPYELTTLTAEGENQLTNTVLSEDSFWTSGWSGQRTYQMEVLTNQVKRYPELIATLIARLDDQKLAGFRKAESHYNEFIYQQYTRLTEDERQLLKKYLGEANVKIGSHMEYEEAKTLILDCLQTNVMYSETLLQREEGKHLVEEFLDSSRAGYSVHYATTAALMFRYYGIPARYVEGYLITPDAVKAAENSDALVITDKSAHAWVEYYQDGIGWIPFEVTPPYMDVMEKPENPHTAGSDQSLDQSSGTGLGMEMIEDNYEPEEPEPDEDKPALPWGKIFIGVGILLLILLAGFLIRHFCLRRRKLETRRQAFVQEDRAAAVAALFGYSLSLHQALGIELQNCSIYAYGDEVAAKISSQMQEAYGQAARLYQKAVYSQRLVTNEEWAIVNTYKEQLLQEIKKNCSLRKRLFLRWVRGLY